MDFSNAGVLLTGDMRSSINSSTASLDEGKHTGLDAYTEGHFVLQARPTKDTRATVMFRAHQDWQKSHEEGMSPYLFDWWSYDGKAVDGKINFNLGDMRVRYTPLTLATPVIDLVQEPELLATRRAEAMAYRHLDGTDARLLQGLNFSYASGQWGVLDNLYYQGTGARLRNQAKKPDQVFFDFDESDRYMLAGRAGDYVNPIAPISREQAERQMAAYPAVSGRRFVLPIDRALDITLAVLRDLNWKVAGRPSAEEGMVEVTVEAVAPSLVFGFLSDVAIRITDESDTTYVDIRSSARYGMHDLGGSAAKIERFYAAFDEELALRNTPTVRADN